MSSLRVISMHHNCPHGEGCCLPCGICWTCTRHGVTAALPLQGMAFTLEERLQLGIHGLLPPCFLSQDVQVLRVMKSYETRTNPLDK